MGFVAPCPADVSSRASTDVGEADCRQRNPSSCSISSSRRSYRSGSLNRGISRTSRVLGRDTGTLCGLWFEPGYSPVWHRICNVFKHDRMDSGEHREEKTILRRVLQENQINNEHRGPHLRQFFERTSDELGGTTWGNPSAEAVGSTHGPAVALRSEWRTSRTRKYDRGRVMGRAD